MHELDNPAWSALTGRHAHLAIVSGPVRRYPAEVSPFAAIESPSALPLLPDLLAPGDTCVLWSPDDIAPPAGLELVVRFACLQMVADEFHPAPVAGDALPLGPAIALEMIDLALLTRPGPFGPRTTEMGRYIGIRENGRLAAMAGERMKPDRYTEVSGICVHPQHLGRGHARRLTSIIGSGIIEDGRVPFLNVLPGNVAAIKLYKSLGFTPRRLMQVHLLRRPGGDDKADPYFSSV